MEPIEEFKALFDQALTHADDPLNSSQSEGNEYRIAVLEYVENLLLELELLRN